MEKQAGFKLHVTLVCYELLQVCSIFFLAKNTNGTLGGFFYHLFSVIYAFLCCTFCENFWKARINISVFKNNVWFQKISIPLPWMVLLIRPPPPPRNFCSRGVMYNPPHPPDSRSYLKLFLIYAVACDACKIIQTFTNIKTVVIVQKIDLIQKY